MPLKPGEREIWALLLDPCSPRFLDFPDPSWPKPRADGQDEAPFSVQFLGGLHKDVFWGWGESVSLVLIWVRGQLAILGFTHAG